MTVSKKETYWSRYAEHYDDYPEYVVGKDLRQMISQRLLVERDLGRVVELGCGTGYFTQAIAKNAAHVTATDLSLEMLEIARLRMRELHNVTVEQADCEATSFGPGTFDTVFLANVIHVIGNPLKALQEGFRILRNDGLLLLISYTDFGMYWFEKMVLGLRYLVKFGVPPPCGLRNYSPAELGRLVERAGFCVKKLTS